MLKIMNDLISWFSEGISPTPLYITSTVFFAMNTKVIYVYESQMCILHCTEKNVYSFFFKKLETMAFGV